MVGELRGWPGVGTMVGQNAIDVEIRAERTAEAGKS